MTAIAAAPRRTASLDAPRLTFSRLVRAEWIGLTSLRGTIASLVVGTVLVLAVSVGMTALLLAVNGDPAGAPPALMMTLGAATVAQIIAVLVGVGVFAKEHATGSLRTQLAAAPRRVATVGAKAVVVAVSTFAWSLASLLLSFAGVVAVGAVWGVEPALDDALTAILLPIVGAALFTALVGVLSLGVAALLRSETWSVTLVLVFLLVLPTVLLTLPFEWAPTIHDALMAPAGDALMTPNADVDGETVRDIAIAFVWPIAALVAGMAVVRRRDA